MIDLEKMAKEHEKLFPNATLESQVWKLEEELDEWSQAKDEQERVKEAADVIIVAGGLYRWCPRMAYDFVFILLQDSEIEAEVNRKWQINLKRKWVWNGKTYHHEGKDD